ncbi:MAG: hypothetical protein WDZ52_02285 [Pseudohongiellaceae bacterium]
MVSLLVMAFASAGMLPLLLGLVNLADPIYSLVAFHSLINIIGVIVFIPLLRYFASWIELVFSRYNSQSTKLLESAPTTVVDGANNSIQLNSNREIK